MPTIPHFSPPDESFLIKLLPQTIKAKGVECVVGKNDAVRVFVLDNDNMNRASEVSFSSPAYTIMESEGIAAVTVQRLGSADCTVSVGYSTYDETARAGDDYLETKGTLTFGPGESKKQVGVYPLNSSTRYTCLSTTSYTAITAKSCPPGSAHHSFDPRLQFCPEQISVPIIDDEGVEPDESFLVKLLPTTIKIKGGGGSKSTDAKCVVGKNGETRVYIVDNDDDYDDNTGGSDGANAAIVSETQVRGRRGGQSGEKVQFAASEYTCNEDDGTLTVIVMRTSAVGTVSVEFTTVDETASAPADYAATRGTLTFGPGAFEMRVCMIAPPQNEYVKFFFICSRSHIPTLSARLAKRNSPFPLSSGL
jgi:hypothetical protein